jgi:hypothetical protein
MDDSRDVMLKFASTHGFDELILYHVHRVVPSRTDELNAFIAKARLSYGVRYISIAGESASFFREKVRDVVVGVDGWNLEFEFWNCNPSAVLGPYYCEHYKTCTNEQGFAFVTAQLDLMREEAPAGTKLETYIGWPERDEQVPALGARVDRLLVHIYGRDAAVKARASGYRIADASLCETNLIISAEAEFSQAELSRLGLEELETLVLDAVPAGKPVSPTLSYFASSHTRKAVESFERYTQGSGYRLAAAASRLRLGL